MCADVGKITRNVSTEFVILEESAFVMNTCTVILTHVSHMIIYPESLLIPMNKKGTILNF